MRRLVSICIFLSIWSLGIAQQITNSGTEFWFAFPEMFDNTRAVYWLNITANDSTSGTVSIPGVNWSQNFSIKAGEVARVNIPSNHATIQGSNLKFNKAIRVSSNDEVVVFAVTYHAFRHEASLVLPNRAVGTRYRVMTYKSEIKSNQLHESEFCVVSIGDTVVVDITPKGNIAGGNNANVTYTDTIYPNQVYQAQARSANDDLTGSLITSKNGKKFAVYSGNVWSTVVCTPNSDPLLEGMFPVNTWGKDYFVIPTPKVKKDYIRIVADQDTTQIYRDGVLRTTLSAGQFYQETITQIRHYTSNKPVALGHFLVTGQGGCTQHINTDPSMIMCNSTEQMFLDSITFFAVDTSAIDFHYVHVITRTADTNTMYLDSNKLSGWTPFTQDTKISYRTVEVKAGYHRLESTGCGFIAYSLGMGRAVSYGYATGASLVDLSNSISYTNFITGTDTICQGDTVHFKSLIRGKPLSFQWFFGDGDTSTERNPIHIYDSTGNYEVKAIVNYSCISDTLIDTLIVPPPPIINLGPDTILCNRDTLRFTVNTDVFKALWSTGSRDSFLVIQQPGTYWSKVYNYCGEGFDTVKIDSLYPDTVNLGPDTILCKGDTLRWDITAVWGSNYKWWDNNNIPLHQTDTGGLYWAEVNNLCGRMRDSIIVYSEETPNIDLGSDTLMCNGQRIQLFGLFSRSKYLWNDGFNWPYRTISAPGGKYWLNVKNVCGEITDTINIKYEYPLNPFLGFDSVICIGDTLLLDPLTNGARCIWHSSSTDSVESVTQKGKYWVEATNACGVYSDTVVFSEENHPVVNLPPDTLICSGKSIDLRAHFSNSTYRWNTGETTPVKTVTTQGTYQVTVSNICGSATDQILVLYDKALNINLGPDTFLCDGDWFDITLNHPNNPNYEWNNGHVGNQFRVQQGGKYSVKVRNRCGVYADEIIVTSMYEPFPNLGNDSIICFGEWLTLKAGIPVDERYGVEYKWSNGRDDPAITVKSTGTYWVNAFNACGSHWDSSYVQVNNIPVLKLPDTVVCFGENLIYDYNYMEGYRLKWNGEIEDNYFVISESGEYRVDITDSIGCGSTDFFEVDICAMPLWVPKAFSPNGDQVNDQFKIFKDGIFFFELEIMDRWNKRVFFTNDITDYWNGGVHNDLGNECPQGQYVWKISFKEASDNQLQIITGEVTLLR